MKMNFKIMIFAFATLVITCLASCSNSESYADLLRDERTATNAYLANYKVINSIPSDSIFETGPNAPYYRLDEDGNVYMQVLKAGNRDSMATSGEKIYFRFMRFNIITWYDSKDSTAEGNAENMKYNPTAFLYGNYTLQSSYQYGYGIQMPMTYLGVDSEVNLVIKSQYGLSDEISDVQPYKYHIRYYRSQI